MNQKRSLLTLMLLMVLALAAILSNPRLVTAQAGGSVALAAPQDTVGTAFTYQGKLTDDGGPANGDYDFGFVLQDAPSFGNQVASTYIQDVPVTEGLFTVELDFGGVFDGTALWMIILVRPGDSTGGYTALSPAQALTAAPYALALPGLWTQPNAISPNLIGGYRGNEVTAGVVGATISGGGGGDYPNRVTADYATVGGGYGNDATGERATIGGGVVNVASGNNATVGGGLDHNASGDSATVSGGYNNDATGDYAAIGGGRSNDATDNYTFVGGGYGNDASGSHATIGGGFSNEATGHNATIGGGYDNEASSNSATVAGGTYNDASGSAATVPGGSTNEASGDYSFAAGRRAQASRIGCFVWADATNEDFPCSYDNQFRVRANGGATFLVDSTAWEWVRFRVTGGHLIDTSTDAHLTTGGVWTNGSDQAAKENFAPVDGQEVLAQLAAVPIQTWNYKAEDPAVRRMGPTAQDFYAAFGLGEDERHIATIDADGVALAAIQALYQRSQALEAENAALQGQLADLEARLAALEQAGGNSRTSGANLPGGWPMVSAVGLLAAAVVLGRRRFPGGGR
jgi:hypothetical protein